MTTMTKPKATPNYAAWKFVDKREEFQGSSMYGATYTKGNAPHMTSDSWLSDFETTQFNRNRPRITYIVWSFYTPIGYFIEGRGKDAGWYLVGQTFSSFTSRHRNGAFRNIRSAHKTTLTGTRGNWTVTCEQCGTTRFFNREANTHGPLRLH